MDNDKIKQFIVPILLIFLTIVGLIVLVPKTIEQLQAFAGAKADVTTKTATYEEKRAQFDQIERQKAEDSAQDQANQASGKPFYKPVVAGMDTDAAIAGEFAEILELVRANKIKVRSMNNNTKPEGDHFYDNASDTYNVARLDLEMIANYVNYDNFLKELYKHEHFLDIESVEIVPYKKNKKILLINLKLKLYAKK